MKKANKIKYQIFVDSANGSAILEEENLDEAIRKAKQWSYNLHGGNDVVILEVKETIIAKSRHGKLTAEWK